MSKLTAHLIDILVHLDVRQSHLEHGEWERYDEHRCLQVALTMQTEIHVQDGPRVVAQFFNERPWLKQGTWPGSFLWFSAILESFSEEWTGRVLNPGLAIRDYACLWREHGAYDCLIGASCFGEIREVMEREHLKNGSVYFLDFAALCESKFEGWQRFSQSISVRGNELATLGNAELANILDTYFEFLRENGAFMDTIIVLADFLGDVIGTKIDELLQSCAIDDPTAFGLFLEIHSEQPLPTNVARAEESIRSLAAQISKSQDLTSLFSRKPAEIVSHLRQEHPDIYEAFENHRNRFGWLNTYSFTGHPYSTEQIVQFAQENLDDISIVAEASRSPSVSLNSTVTNEVRNIAIPSEVRELLSAIRSLSYVNAAKDDAHQITWQMIRPLISIIAKRLQHSLEELLLCTPKELSDALNGGALNSGYLAARAQGWTLLKIHNVLHVVQGRESVDELNRGIKTILPENVNCIKGKPVFAGRVRGKVKIVLTSADCDQVNSGDILVATNTSPDFIPAMRRAAAFVTDSGNLICHAVIAAREFRKPCVIGTQVATQLLKDGEWIEVDGVSGVVTRLNATAEIR